MYLVNVRVYRTKEEQDKEEGQILKVRFHWKRTSRIYKGFEPTPATRKILDQYVRWENLDIDKPTESLRV